MTTCRQRRSEIRWQPLVPYRYAESRNPELYPLCPREPHATDIDGLSGHQSPCSATNRSLTMPELSKAESEFTSATT